jgi:hypothetical protein
MLKSGIPIRGAGAEDNDGSDERIEKALADGNDRSRAETREKHLTTWSEMMNKGGVTKWLGS